MVLRQYQVYHRPVSIKLLPTNVALDSVQAFDRPVFLQVRANHPVPATNEVFYFEVTVVNGGVRR